MADSILLLYEKEFAVSIVSAHLFVQMKYCSIHTNCIVLHNDLKITNNND